MFDESRVLSSLGTKLVLKIHPELCIVKKHLFSPFYKPDLHPSLSDNTSFKIHLQPDINTSNILHILSKQQVIEA